MPCRAPRLPLPGVLVDRSRMCPAEGAWVSWWGTGWAAVDSRDARLVALLTDDPATMAVCLTQSLAWCRALVEAGEAMGDVRVSDLRRAVAHVEACGMRPPVEGGRVREDGLPVRGPTRPRSMVNTGVPDGRFVTGVLAWSLRLWWMGLEGDVRRVHVGLGVG